MTDPVPVPDEEATTPEEAIKKAKKVMVAAVPDAIKALRELAANSSDADVRLKAAEMLLTYGVPATRGGTRGDIL